MHPGCHVRALPSAKSRRVATPCRRRAPRRAAVGRSAKLARCGAETSCAGMAHHGGRVLLEVATLLDAARRATRRSRKVGGFEADAATEPHERVPEVSPFDSTARDPHRASGCRARARRASPIPSRGPPWRSVAGRRLDAFSRAAAASDLARQRGEGAAAACAAATAIAPAAAWRPHDAACAAWPPRRGRAAAVPTDFTKFQARAPAILMLRRCSPAVGSARGTVLAPPDLELGFRRGGVRRRNSLHRLTAA